MAKKLKYPNLKALSAAFASAELKREEWVLVLDNDDAFLRYIGPTPEGEDEDCYRDRKNDGAREKLYRGNGYADLSDAVEAAGIPCEWC